MRPDDPGGSVIDLTPEELGHAGQRFADGQRRLDTTSSNLWETLCGSAGMAGGDEAGESFAQRYDPAVASLLDLLGAGIGTFGAISRGLVQTARNYATAEHHSTARKGVYLPDFADPPVSESVSFGTPNTAAGGHIGGVNRFLAKFWPQGDVERIRAAASAFRTAQSELQSLGSDAEGVVDELMGSNVSPALQSFEQVWLRTWSGGTSGSLGKATDACGSLAHACDSYADRIEEAHHDLEIAAAAVGIVTTAGVVLTIFTVGLSDAAAAGVDAAVAEECAVIATEFAADVALEVEVTIEAGLVPALETAAVELPEVGAAEAEVEATVTEWEADATEIEELSGEPAVPTEADIDRLGYDPAVKAVRPSEGETGFRIEQEGDVHLERAPEPAPGEKGPDWVDPETGATYDAVGNFPAEYFDQQWPTLQSRIVDHLAKADWVPVDVSQWTPAQVAVVEQFIAQYAPRVYIVGGG